MEHENESLNSENDSGSSRQIIISADGHAGADLLDYKPYLDRKFHDEFDDWANSFFDPWGQVSNKSSRGKSGLASFDVPLNWDSKKRLEYTEAQGIAAEVLFPNTAPPFFPSGRDYGAGTAGSPGV